MTQRKFLLVFIVLPTVGNTCRALSSSHRATKKATIAVCTGPDCRVDGSADCLRQLQQLAGPATVRVTGRPCIGPCGDGPCVLVLDSDGEKVIEPQPSKKQVSLVEPDLFGSNPKGWYQVRTHDQVNEVMAIAVRATGGDTMGVLSDKQSQSRTAVASYRAWFDRPRNERKVLQRLMQFTVLCGLFSYEDPTELQYLMAGALLLSSTAIMRENIWTLIQSQWKRAKRKTFQ